jgi:hypothetical protein
VNQSLRKVFLQLSLIRFSFCPFHEATVVFFFYSNDEPIHVHVRHAGGEAVFMVVPSVELRESSGMRVHDLRKAQELADENKDLIVRNWHEHLDLFSLI